MSKPDERKTFFEKLYEKKLAVMPCCPVLMSSFLKTAGFAEIERFYMASNGLIVTRLWGQEIVTGKKNMRSL